jgi:hypothetical protein
MAKFEDAVLKALGRLPKHFWQRVDGLMCEHEVLETYPQWFPQLRLWLMTKRGLIERGKVFRRGQLMCYRLPQSDGMILVDK